MRAFAVPTLLLLATLLPGCVDVPDPGAGVDAEADAAGSSVPFTWGFNATACQEAMILLLIPKAELQAHLPEGFVVADASGLVSAQLPGGALDRGVLFANAYACDSTDLAPDAAREGQVAVFVEAPDVAGERPAALYDFYELGRVTPSQDQRDRLDGIGWPTFAGNVTSTMGSQGGSGAVEQDGAAAWSIDLTLPGSQALAGIARFWHAPPGGLAYADYIFDDTQLLGSAQCEIADGSVLASFTSIRSCSPENALGSGFESFDPRFELHWLPNATVEG